MTIADDDQNPRPGKKLAKSLDAISALRNAMEQRLAETKPEESAPKQPTPSENLKPETEQPRMQKPESSAGKDDPSKESMKEFRFYDPVEFSQNMFRIAERSQRLIRDYIERQKGNAVEFQAFDPTHISDALLELTRRILNDPENFANAQIALWQGYFKLWQQALARMQGQIAEPLVTPAASDKRFLDKDWQNNWIFDFIKQSYLLTAQWTNEFVKQEAKKLDPKLAHKVDFYIDQILDAMSPSNFWLTNPQVLRTTLETGGENLVKGLENLLGDLERGQGQLRISMTDASAFKVGGNIGITPGKVIYRNKMIELMQYEPLTPQVHRVPLLIIPPWINKFYILDLREKNSFIRYLVSQGHTVFCISWANPDASFVNVNFDDYMVDGAFAAMREIKKAIGEKDINVLGYCIGGTLLASTLGYLEAAPAPPDLPKINSATYLVTMIDFAEAGDLSVFIDDDQIKTLEARMAKQGYLDAASLAVTFNMLRSNDLIWSFVVNNYLLGKEPFPFDILYWNSDSTNLPAAMHSFYLRKMYMDNLLCVPNGLTMKDVPIDLTKITTPSFLLSTREDHIAPWKSTYVSTQLYKGPVKFVLSGSGHIAGVINPPTANKYGYWTNDTCPENPEDWMKGAEEHQGSWWPEWIKWLESYAGEQVPAREVKAGIEAAPGSYVLVRAV